MWNENLEELVVVKRSGQRVEFNASKIAIAIKKAYESTFNEIDDKKIFKVFEKVLNFINNIYKDRKTISVEDIQDIIEKMLKESNELEVYETFNEYRNKRALSRKVFTEKGQHKFLKPVEKVEEQARAGIKKITPNQMFYKYGSIISSEYAKSYILDNKYVREFEEGNIYVHNLDYFSLGKFSHFNYKIDDKTEQLEDLIYNIKNSAIEINDKIALSLIDYKFEFFILKEYQDILKNTLKKYLALFGLNDYINFKKYEDIINKINDIDETDKILNDFKINAPIKLIIEKSVSDAKEEIKTFIQIIVKLLFKILNLDNSNVTFDISVGNNNSFIGLSLKKEIINYLDSHDNFKKVCVIFKLYSLDDDFGNDILNLVLKKKNVLIEFVSNNEDMLKKEYFSDGLKVYDKMQDNLSLGRLSISATSINLARLALKNKDKNMDEFYKDLNDKMEFVKNQLLLIFEYIGDKTKNNYETLFNGNVYDDEKLDKDQKIRKVIKSGVLNIGIVGLVECVNILEENQKKQEKVLVDILERITKKCEEYSEENKIKFCVFEPSDTKSRKYLLKIDKAIYGNIKGITDKECYLKINDFINNYQKINEYLTGGILYELNVPINISSKKLLENLKELQKRNIKLIRVRVGKV